MAVTGTPVPAAGALSSDDIRWFLRDYSGNNILLGNVEFSDSDISRAVLFAVDEYNILPPPIGTATAETINRAVLLRGVCSYLLSSESILQLRNQATYQAEGLPRIGVDDKYQDYGNLALKLREEFKELAIKIKQRDNMEDAFGHIHSEYRDIGRWTRG